MADHPSLRAYLDSIPQSLLRVPAMSVLHEITALQYALEAQGRRPVVLVQRPRLPDGSDSALPVVCNLTASRVLTAAALGIADHRQAARAFAEMTGQPIPPIRVAMQQAPVQQHIERGEAASLERLPALKQHALDPGRYLTASHAITIDPDSGVDNTAIQRSWIKGPRRMSWYPYPSTHNARNLRKWWAKGKPCPVAFWIGHHPAVSIGAQAKLAYGESHWGAAGALAGSALRLVPSLTHGDALMVPADAEVVIEGFAPPGVLEADGPFGEYAGYMGAQTLAPVCEVTAITRRSDAIWHDYASGLADMLVPDNMALEGKLWQMIRAVTPSIEAIHIPVSGRRFHAWLQLRDPAMGEARDALTAALAQRRIKMAVAVNGDVDIFSDADMMWALATRVQWSRDTFTLEGMSGSALDPSWAAGARTTSKIGIDATLAPGVSGLSGAAVGASSDAAGSATVPAPVAPRSAVPEQALRQAQAVLGTFQADGHAHDWPTL